MIRARFAFATLSLLALSACASPAAPPSQLHTGGPPPPSQTICQADAAQWAIGQQASADVIERVRHDSHSRVTRVIRPGEMITMDFLTDRVDLQVDTGNVIIQVRCG